MKSIISNNKQTMTIREVAKVLGKDESTIRKIGKHLFPELFRNGIKTYFNEAQVTSIKMNLGKNSELPKTNLEKELVIMQALQFQQEKITELKSENKIMKPKAIAYDTFMSAKNAHSIGTVAKLFGLGRNRLFEILRKNQILMSNNVPYQSYTHHFDVKMEQIKIGSNVENMPVTYVKPSGVRFIMNRFNLNSKTVF